MDFLTSENINQLPVLVFPYHSLSCKDTRGTIWCS